MSDRTDVPTLTPALSQGEREKELANIIEQMADELRELGKVDVAAWRARYPELASEIARLVPTLGLLADFSAPGGDESDTDAHDSFQGKTLGDFRIVRELGRGGMGIVYEAEQLSLNRRVALKILPTAAVLDPRTLQRFKNEAQAAAALDHPHIVDVYGIGAERGVHYYAMRLIDGCTLADVIGELRGQGTGVRDQKSGARKQGSTAPLALLSTVRSANKMAFHRLLAELGIHVAEALEQAHGQGVIHRDIKPSNLMLDCQGKVWITDFGLARIEANPSLTVTGDLLGTLRYMSPEQALANRVPVDHRTDIYSLGATLYELATLSPLFGEADRATLIHKIAFVEPPQPRKVNPQVPADFETILLKMLEKDSGSRYASDRALADDLRRFVENQPIHARRRSWSQQVAKWAARNRPLVATVGVAMLVLMAVNGGILGWQARDASARRMLVGRMVESALESAAIHERNDEWPGALIEIQKAEAALAGEETGNVALRKRVAARARDVELVLRLDAIRLLAAASAGGDFDFATADRAYAEAFANYGIDVATLPRAAAIVRLERASIRDELAAALTNWSIVRKRAGVPDRPAWHELLRLAKVVDADPWRNRLREAFEPEGILQDELTALVLTAPLENLPASTLFLLVQIAANRRVAGDDVVTRLGDVQHLHADDFWINFALARYFEQAEPPAFQEAVRFYSVSAALRPGTAAVHNNLGAALHKNGKKSEAAAEFRRAIAVEPSFAAAYSNLGFALCEEGRFGEAEEIVRKGLAIHMDWPEMHCNLAAALAGQGRVDDAAAAYRRALELRPGHAIAFRGLESLIKKEE